MKGQKIYSLLKVSKQDMSDIASDIVSDIASDIASDIIDDFALENFWFSLKGDSRRLVTKKPVC